MTQANTSPRVTEPFVHALRRNLLIALAVGGVFAARSGEVGLLLKVSVLALWFSLGGHYVELTFLNGVRPRLAPSRMLHVVARVAFWFLAGVALYWLMLSSARLLFEHPPAGYAWWVGGAAFVLVELVVHITLALRRAPNFFDGRG